MPAPRALASARARNRRAGFTLIEIIAVVAIIAMVFALGVPRLWRSSAFGTAGKVGWTIVGVVNTAGVFVVLYVFGAHWLPSLLRPVREALGR